MEGELLNKVAESGLISFDLEELYLPGKRVFLDIKPWLFEDLILKEKDFRQFVKEHNWSDYQDCLVAVGCTAEAIVPTWAYMLLTTRLEPFAKKIAFGSLQTLEESLFAESLQKINPESYRDKRVVIKGCSHFPVPVSAYVTLTALLRPFAKSIMYGEPCSTVPLYKRKD